MTYLAKITTMTISAFRTAQGTPIDRYDVACTVASNLYMYGDKKTGILPFDLPAYEQAMEALDKSFMHACAREKVA